MTTTGIIRRVDDLGRVLIPKEIRRQYGITDGFPIEFFLENGAIVLKPYQAEKSWTPVINSQGNLHKNLNNFMVNK